MYYFEINVISKRKPECHCICIWGTHKEHAHFVALVAADLGVIQSNTAY